MSGSDFTDSPSVALPLNLLHFRRMKFFDGLSSEEAQEVLGGARRVRFSRGDVICRQGEEGGSMFIIVDGHVKVSAVRGSDEEVVLNYLNRGDHFGEVSLLVSAPRMASVTAVIDSELLEVDRAQFHKLVQNIPRVAANLSRSLGTWLHAESTRRPTRRGPSVVALVRSDGVTRLVATQLAEELTRRGDVIHVITDREGLWSESEKVHLTRLARDAATSELVRHLRREIADSVEQGRRVLVDVERGDSRQVASIATQCEQFWWLAEADRGSSVTADLRRLIEEDPTLSKRLRVVWVLHVVRPLAPAVDHGIAAAGPDMRVACESSGDGEPRLREGDAARLAHHLQGTHLALALGGGGARGMTHVGVMRAFEKEHIHFDRIAGTSIGSLVAAMYACGITLDGILQMLVREMTPPKWLRMLPGGSHWHLWAVLRFHIVESMMRRHIRDCSFEQLMLPVHTVSVDLITGNIVVRERGDAIAAVHESLNVPGISRPILRGGQALVDGGVLDNLPASVLRDRRAQFVVGVNISSKLLHKLGRNDPTTPTARMRQAGLLETMMRIIEVQQHGLASVGVSASDFLIEPDTSRFAFDGFSRGEEMAEVGQAAAEEAIPRLRQMLVELGITP